MNILEFEQRGKAVERRSLITEANCAALMAVAFF